MVRQLRRSRSQLTLGASRGPPGRRHSQDSGARGRLGRTNEEAEDENEEAEAAAATATTWSPRRWRRRQMALRRFRKCANAVAIAMRWLSTVVNRGRSGDAAHAVDSLKRLNASPDDLTFNVSHFKAKREVELSPELKHILQLHPGQRTGEQLRSLTRGLQNLATFNEYPLHIQHKLAKVVRHHSVPAGRVIVRQGHAGVNFYIILSGRAFVHVMRGEEDAIVARLGQGQAFGEVALLREVTRTASVVSAEPMELLAIGRHEFQEIFATSESGRVSQPLRLLLSCQFMRGFPLAPLLSQPSACRITFYRRNCVIVSDSKTHPDLVLVKSGTCRVVKRLLLGNEESAEDTTPGRRRRLSETDGKRMLQPSHGHSYPKIDTGLNRPAAGAFGSSISRKRLALHRSIPGLPSAVVTQARDDSDEEERQRLRRSTSELPKKSVVVEICVLKAGDVFGLSNVIFPDERNDEIEESASVSLVSNGAECILLNRSFFVHHATEAVRRRVRSLARPYPCESEFESNYRREVAWSRYRRRVFKEALAHRRK